jgi:hypothetical protein
MKRIAVITVVMVVLLLAGQVRAGVGVVVNGSFEYDGKTLDITTEAPYRWCDVNVPVPDFSGKVSGDVDWLIHGDHYLEVSSNPYQTFTVGDMAIVSQHVYLTDINEIMFNVELNTMHTADPWDPGKRSAVVLIDDEVVWESNSVGSDVRGEYYDQIYTVHPQYQDADSHKLSLGIRVNAGGSTTYTGYMTKWDVVRFNTHCGGFGYLPEDFDRDCYVNGVDLGTLVEQWLVEGPEEEYDLFKDGIIDFDDFSFFADYWMANSDSSNWRDDNCYEAELPAIDLDDDGIVSFVDYALLMDEWGEVPEGTCLRGDIDGSGEVGYTDLCMLLDGWLEKSWLYGL